MTRILLVEREGGEADEMTVALAGHEGWEVVRARSVLDAIRTAGDSPFDAAVLDCDLPDGTGLDLLDFLRLGSPHIRIVVVSGHGSEALAYEALSRGANDYLVKDRRLPRELPLRMDALLRSTDPVAAVVETLSPLERPPVASEAPAFDEVPEPPVDDARKALEALEESLKGNAFAGAVYDARGRVLAQRLVPPLDPDGLGFALATLHAQVGALGMHTELRPLSYAMLVQVEGGLLGLTAVPGPRLVALLLATSTPHDRALRLLAECARNVSEALKG